MGAGLQRLAVSGPGPLDRAHWTRRGGVAIMALARLWVARRPLGVGGRE
ncbi:MAG: hypothetical protein AVDCRST_MAG15-846 [uncultured Rubellimicrobium sp.]|uniref:Uncharacterized protein n=1 Tax=uncultured Rubellimicrobium sp. TaxID=543078 RepID=A0A6J4NUV0_9RHOB|nr:MAG: hypothetical protein AVDCRST_MAG15-846 [uncultured Rubellimicrobium sp.]